MSGALDVEEVGDVALAELVLEVACGLEDEGVVSVGGEGVALGEAVVDEEGELEALRGEEGGVEGGVLVSAEGEAGPVEDEFALGVVCGGADASEGAALAEVCGEGLRDVVRGHRVALRSRAFGRVMQVVWWWVRAGLEDR